MPRPSIRRIVVNGRFLTLAHTGVQRYGVETLRALDAWLGREPQHLQGTRWQLAVPCDAADPPLLEHFEIHTLQFFGGGAWEQLSLALFARGAYLVNLNCSAPLAKRDQLITLHDASLRAYPCSGSLGHRLLGRALTTVIAPRVDSVMAVSRFSAPELKARLRLARDDIAIGRAAWERATHAHASADANARIVLDRLIARGAVASAQAAPADRVALTAAAQPDK